MVPHVSWWHPMTAMNLMISSAICRRLFEGYVKSPPLVMENIGCIDIYIYIHDHVYVWRTLISIFVTIESFVFSSSK